MGILIVTISIVPPAAKYDFKFVCLQQTVEELNDVLLIYFVYGSVPGN